MIAERCIGCGTCVRVCAQKAKRIESGIEHTWELLAADSVTFAIVAPSFPAAFPIDRPHRVVGALHELGFDKVMDNDLSVFIRKDIVANYVRDMIEQDSQSAADERFEKFDDVDRPGSSRKRTFYSRNQPKSKFERSSHVLTK